MIRVLFEDEVLIALDKPTKMHSADLPGKSGETVAQFVKGHCSGTEALKDFGLINRLDFETSGVLLAAKSPSAYAFLRDQSLTGGMRKEYLAIVEGKFEGTHSVKSWLGSRYRRSEKVTVYPFEQKPEKRALLAETSFAALTYDAALDLSLVRATLKVGRRHQVRAHASHLGHPLWGDKLYSAVRALETSGVAPAFFLHAQKVVCTHPETKAALSFESDAPEYFRSLGSGVFGNCSRG